MDDPAWRAGYALMERYGLSYDLQTPWWHLDAAADLARDFPRTTIVINHTGLPADRSAEGLALWRRALETAARQPNVCIKISGLGRRGQPWTVEANAPLIRDLRCPALHVRKQLSGRPARRFVPDHLSRLLRSGCRSALRGTVAIVS